MLIGYCLNSKNKDNSSASEINLTEFCRRASVAKLWVIDCYEILEILKLSCPMEKINAQFLSNEFLLMDFFYLLERAILLSDTQ